MPQAEVHGLVQSVHIDQLGATLVIRNKIPSVSGQSTVKLGANTGSYRTARKENCNSTVT